VRRTRRAVCLALATAALAVWTTGTLAVWAAGGATRPAAQLAPGSPASGPPAPGAAPGGQRAPTQTLPSAAAPGEPAPGSPATTATVAELRASLTRATQRFEALDAPGVLALVSDHYRTGPLTKPALREQLHAVYGLYDAVKAQVRIDEVRMVGEHAWIYSTGEVSGRVRILGHWMVFLSWNRELEVARREAGGWRLYGYQQ
jgi:hypothetical protein